MILYIHDILCHIVYTLHHRSAWSGLSQAGSPLGGFEYSGAEAEQRARRHPADQRRSQSVTAEVFSNIYSLNIQTEDNENTDVACYYFRHSVRLHEGFCSSFRQDQQGLAHLVERELKRVSQRLDQLSRHHQHQSHTLSPHDELRLHTGRAQQIPILYIMCNLSQLLHYPKWLPTVDKLRGIHKSIQVTV